MYSKSFNFAERIMHIQFYKFQGTGNDFVMLDNRKGIYDGLSIGVIQQLCDRRFGIGADGLIKLNAHTEFDFEMDYYNSDGSKSFCGNGARCAVAFADLLGMNVSNTTFLAIDGVHNARLIDEFIYLEMKDVDDVIESEDSYIADTGSPHYMIFVDRLSERDVLAIGRQIRYNEQYKKDGINVNLIEQKSDLSIGIRTYERGVENETLSCGTGATACALALAEKNNLFGKMVIDVDVQGGALKVAFERSASGNYKAIELIGPAVFVFKGEIDV